MEVVQELAGRLGIRDRHFGAMDPWLVNEGEGWVSIQLVDMPEVSSESVYGLPLDTPALFEHGCHLMWALIHIAKRRPTAGSGIERQAGRKNCDAWFFVPLDCSAYAEQYAVPTRVCIEGFPIKVVQTKLRISTRQALRASQPHYKKAKEMNQIKFEELLVREVTMSVFINTLCCL
jgi:hypothetical protein